MSDRFIRDFRRAIREGKLPKRDKRYSPAERRIYEIVTRGQPTEPTRHY